MEIKMVKYDSDQNVSHNLKKSPKIISKKKIKPMIVTTI